MKRGRHRIDRVLVAIDASAASLAAADSAARVASLLDAELVGLFVEDRELLRLSASPLARQVGPYGDRGEAATRSDAVGRQLRAQATRASGRDALELACRFVADRPDRLSLLTTEAAQKLVRQGVEEALGENGRSVRIESADLTPEAIARYVKQECAGVLLLSATSIPRGEDTSALLNAVDCPVLVVS